MESEGKVCVVFGATGRLGRLLVDAALVHGMKVRAIVRPQSKYTDERANVEVLKVNIEDVKKIEPALQGSDVIFSALRSRSAFFDNGDMVRYIRNITDAMSTNDYDVKSGIAQRLIICSCISSTYEGQLRMSFISRMGLFFQRGRVADLQRLEVLGFSLDHPDRIANLSVPEFTIIRPTNLSDCEKSDAQVVSYENEECGELQSTIPRANVVDFLFQKCYLKDEGVRGSLIIGLKPLNSS